MSDSNNSEVTNISRLFRIRADETTQPFALFEEWLGCATQHTSSFIARTMNLATVSKEGMVSNRSVLMVEADDEGLLFITSKTGRKYEDIQNHPQVGICFQWTFKMNDQIYSRQVRMEGIAKEMDLEFSRGRFRSASFRTKLRLAFCRQGNVVDWDTLKRRNDTFLQSHSISNSEVDLPEHSVYYRVKPHRIEFYESNVDPITIGDRILYRKDQNNEWYSVHLEA